MEFNCEVIEIPDEITFNRLLNEFLNRVNEIDFPVTPRTDDSFLSKFLRAKNYVVDDALVSIKRYYANVQRNFNFIKDIRPSDFTETFTNGPMVFFKHRSKGRRIGAIHLSRWKPKEISLRDVQLTAVLIVEQILTEVETQEKGVIVIFDLKGLTFEQIRKMTPRELKRILLTGQEALPIKISEVHIVNPPPFYWTLYQLSLRFVKEKIRKRIHLHSTEASLLNYLDPAICPVSLGGMLSDMEAHDTELVEGILHKNTPYENLWNGGITHQKSQKLSRKRSSNGDFLFGKA